MQIQHLCRHLVPHSRHLIMRIYFKLCNCQCWKTETSFFLPYHGENCWFEVFTQLKRKWMLCLDRRAPTVSSASWGPDLDPCLKLPTSLTCWVSWEGNSWRMWAKPTGNKILDCISSWSRKSRDPWNQMESPETHCEWGSSSALADWGGKGGGTSGQAGSPTVLPKASLGATSSREFTKTWFHEHRVQGERFFSRTVHVN